MTLETKLAALGVAFGLMGMGLLLFPRFMMALRGRMSIGVARWLIDLFPEKVQTAVGRILGIGFLVLGAWICSVYAPVGFGLKKDPKTLKEWKSTAYKDTQYHEQAVVDGPAYTQAVIKELRISHRWYYYESPEPFVITIIKPDSFQMVRYGFLEAMKHSAPPRQLASEINGKLEKDLEDDKAELQKAGTYQQEIAKRQQEYGPRMLQKAQEEYRAIQGSQSAQLAAASLKKASDYWQLDDKQSALRFAKEARDAYARLLGPYHPKVKQIDAMIQAAGGQ